MRHGSDRSGRSAESTRTGSWGGQADEERFRSLIEAGADGMLVVRRDGTIGFANPAACALLARDEGSLVGQPFGIPIVPGETTEVDIPRCDGSFRIAEMRAAAAQWRGEPAHLASLRDITERKRAEEAAREANATLRSFYDASQMMMGVVEIREADILFVSSNNATASFYGVGVEGLDGRRISRLGVAPGVIDLWIARYREAERTGMPVRFEYAHEARGGRTWLSVTVGYIGRTPKGCSQFSFVAEDVSDRKLAEEALREADRRKDEFLAMLAHELRNPLAAISNAVQLALRTGPGDRWAWSHEVIGRQCAHLTGLIDDLLDVSRITRGKIQLRTEPLDAGSVLHDALEVVRPLIEERKHQLDVSIGPGLRLEADPTRLEQILVNLLTNSAKYTEPG